MDKLVISTPPAPPAVGPYSQAVAWEGLIFLSGQVAGEEGLSPGAQTDRIMERIRRILEDAGSDMDHILKCTIHLSDPSCFEEVNQAYRRWFPGSFPARLCVYGVHLYGGVHVEIDAIAARKEAAQP